MKQSLAKPRIGSAMRRQIDKLIVDVKGLILLYSCKISLKIYFLDGAVAFPFSTKQGMSFSERIFFSGGRNCVVNKLKIQLSRRRSSVSFKSTS
jgi:hypothetical protein